MQFTQLTIARAIEHIETQDYVIPVIQRDYVWHPTQVESLFDSMMRGYPIGTFLFWQVPSETLTHYPFFAFAKDVVRNSFSPERVELTSKQTVTAVLDGQQRLTSFLMAIKGSYTSPGRGRSGLQRKRMFIDLMALNEEASEEKPAYSFRFMTDEELARADEETTHWYPVGGAAELKLGPQLFDYIRSHNLQDHEHAHNTLFTLSEKLQREEIISYYLEETEDIGRVLNIFVRLNRGGTTLSYPDLLLSAATTGWKSRDARKEFADLLDRVNRNGFEFKKDRLLKTGMVLSEFPDIKFKAESFRPENALLLEEHWSEIAQALPVAAELLASFGLDESTLTAENVIIPIAYYVKHRKLRSTYVRRNAAARDRASIQSFVLRSLLKGSFWTGAVDPILLETRRVIQAEGGDRFPLPEIESALLKVAHKSLKFSADEIDALLDSKYGRRTTRLVLALLYPGIDLTEEYHQDHVVPRFRITERRLRARGLDQSSIQRAISIRDTVPNLQLLHGTLNREKSKKSLAEYLQSIWPDAKRRHYIEDHDLPFELSGEERFLDFYDARRQIMKARLAATLSS